MSLTYIELKVIGAEKLINKFYNDNKITKDDVEVNSLLYKKESKLSFEKAISSTIINSLFNNYVQNKNNKFQINNVKNSEQLYSFLYGSFSNAYNIDVDTSKVGENGYILYTFNTKKSAPLIWIHTIVEKYASLNFEVNISNEHNQHIVNTLIFENGKLIKNETINVLEEFYKKNNKEHVFNEIITYMKSKNIDYKKYINRIYNAHYKECENDETQIDYEGVLEEFIEKVKIEKFINKLFENNDSLFYFYSKEFIFYIKDS